jgi:hypothetical protein
LDTGFGHWRKCVEENLRQTLVRSHLEFEKGWPGISFDDYLDVLKARGHLAVIQAVYDRCIVSPKIWDHIDSIKGGWTYPAGNEISQGFNFICKDPAALRTLMNASTKFCKDGANCHGPRDTYRELITAGPGLHVCITQVGNSLSDFPHDIHIDKFQTICKRKTDGFCDYSYVDMQMVNHMRHVIPWWIGERFKNL